MINKTAPLYFEIHTNSTKPSGYIRNSYRKNGKVCHDTISRINGCTLEQLKRMKAAFDGKDFTSCDIKIKSGREYGASKMLFDLATKIGLPDLLYSRKERWVTCALALIIGRIVYAGSKLSLSKAPLYSCLWEICTGTSDRVPVDVNTFCYDTMDEILKRKSLIQAKLAKKHLGDGCVILYDITSSYLEGEHSSSELVDFGYNRDKKRGHKQIVIGLVCSKDGCPISVEVFKGNTNDGKTVESKISEIKNKYGINEAIFVGDRGMLTKTNLKKCDGMPTITALTHSDIRKLCDREDVQLSMFDVSMPTEIIFPEEPNVRYALKKNPERAKAMCASRQAILAKIEEKLADVANPKRKVKAETLGARVGKIFAKYGNAKYFEWSVEGMTVNYSRKLEKIADDEKYDGLYVIRATVSPKEMSTVEFVETYKKLINVEQAFRNLKTTRLELRPIYHKTDDRIKSHVFICMMSYYLLWHLTKELKQHENDISNHSLDTILEIMKSRQKCDVLIGDIECEIISDASEQQNYILSCLGIA